MVSDTPPGGGKIVNLYLQCIQQASGQPKPKLYMNLELTKQVAKVKGSTHERGSPKEVNMQDRYSTCLRCGSQNLILANEFIYSTGNYCLFLTYLQFNFSVTPFRVCTVCSSYTMHTSPYVRVITSACPSYYLCMSELLPLYVRFITSVCPSYYLCMSEL